MLIERFLSPGLLDSLEKTTRHTLRLWRDTRGHIEGVSRGVVMVSLTISTTRYVEEADHGDL